MSKPSNLPPIPDMTGLSNEALGAALRSMWQVSDQKRSDEALGEIVRRQILQMHEADRQRRMMGYSGAHALMQLAHKTGEDELTIDLEDAHFKDEPIGNWRVTVKRVTK